MRPRQLQVLERYSGGLGGSSLLTLLANEVIQRDMHRHNARLFTAVHLASWELLYQTTID